MITLTSVSNESTSSSPLGGLYFGRGPEGAVDDETEQALERDRADANHGRRPGGGLNGGTAPNGGT